MSFDGERWIQGGTRGIRSLVKERYRAQSPQQGEVTIEVRACGMNPIDYINVNGGGGDVPGFEVSGQLVGVGPSTSIGSGRAEIGEEVLAFRIYGGYSSVLTVPAEKVFAKPASIPFEQAANLLLTGSTAAEMLYRTTLGPSDTVLIHGASGAVGISAVQQARLRGARVIGTAAEQNFDLLRRFGAEPVTYGQGLAGRVIELAPEGVSVAFDAVGTDEAIDVSIELVGDVNRIASSAAFDRNDGFWLVGYSDGSVAYRDSVRQHLIDLAGAGKLVVPIGETFPFDDAPEALSLLSSGHPGGKLALIV